MPFTARRNESCDDCNVYPRLLTRTECGGAVCGDCAPDHSGVCPDCSEDLDLEGRLALNPRPVVAGASYAAIPRA